VRSRGVFYVVNANEIVSMTTDALSSSIPILSGENRKRTTTSYTQTSLDGNSYVVYQTAVDPSNGGNATSVTQVQIGPNGAVAGQQDANDNGGYTSTLITDSLTIGPNGRMTSATGTLVFYDIGTDSAFVLGTNPAVPFGCVEQQSPGIDQTTLSGSYFFGGGAPVAGASFDSGVANFNVAGPLSVTDDQTSPFGVGSTPLNLIYTVSSTPRPGAVAFQMGGPT
jgi:hypothetical protein